MTFFLLDVFMSIKNVAFFVFVRLFNVFMLFMPVKFSCKKSVKLVLITSTIILLVSIPNVFAERILRLRPLKNGSALLVLMSLFLLVISFLFIPDHCGWTHCRHSLQHVQVNFTLLPASCIHYYRGFSFWLIFVTYMAYTVTVFRVTYTAFSC